MCSLGWPGTHTEQRLRDSSASPSIVLGLKVCTTIPAFFIFFLWSASFYVIKGLFLGHNSKYSPSWREMKEQGLKTVDSHFLEVEFASIVGRYIVDVFNRSLLNTSFFLCLFIEIGRF